MFGRPMAVFLALLAGLRSQPVSAAVLPPHHSSTPLLNQSHFAEQAFTLPLAAFTHPAMGQVSYRLALAAAALLIGRFVSADHAILMSMTFTIPEGVNNQV